MAMFIRKLLLVLFMMVNMGDFAIAENGCGKDGRNTYSDGSCNDSVTIGTTGGIESSSDLEQGMSAFEKGKYEVAFAKLNPLSEAGVAMAQNIVGRMYSRRRGVPLDYNQALLLFRKAAGQGLPNAQNNLGVMYAAGQGVQQDYRQAVAWFMEAANQGYALAMDNLADMYMNGLGVKRDREEARRWRVKAHSAGFSGKNDTVRIKTVGDDEYKKGLEFYYRWKFAEAAELFLQAAKKGHPEAQLRMGVMYRQGQGVKKDEIEALYWTNKAELAGYTMEDGRDRILLIDSSAEKTEGTSHAKPDQDDVLRYKLEALERLGQGKISGRKQQLEYLGK